MKTEISLYTKHEFPLYSSFEQTQKINELLGADESYFSINDIFINLPGELNYNGHIGYLNVGILGIEWTSVNTDWKLNVVYSSSTIPNKDVFDCFIECLEFLDKINYNAEI